MRTYIASVVAAVAMASSELEFKFLNWMMEHGKEYQSLEHFEQRFAIWVENHNLIENHNAQNKSYTLAHNHMSDWTDDEYKTTLGLTMPHGENDFSEPFESEANGIPSSIDWVAKGKVTHVKDQGQCGSCWSFSATGAMESAYAIEHGVSGSAIPVYSEQQLVDCSTSYGNNGCGGGWYYWAWNYAESKALEGEGDYPYKAVDESCRYQSTQGKEKVNKYSKSSSSNDSVKAMIATGPASVAIDASSRSFGFYKDGVFNDCTQSIDHAILAVGYGHDSASGLDYIKIKNSWNTTWGDQGFAKIQIGKCGINYYVYRPVVA